MGDKMLHIGLISKNKNVELIKELNLYEDVQAVNIKEISHQRRDPIDILVIEDHVVKKEIIETLMKEIHYLIIQDHIHNIQLNLDREISVITFGFNHKSTVTISSVTEENIVICIQRMIRGIHNQVIQPGESIIKNTNQYNINKHIIKKIIEEIIEK